MKQGRELRGRLGRRGESRYETYERLKQKIKKFPRILDLQEAARSCRLAAQSPAAEFLDGACGTVCRCRMAILSPKRSQLGVGQQIGTGGGTTVPPPQVGPSVRVRRSSGPTRDRTEDRIFQFSGPRTGQKRTGPVRSGPRPKTAHP